MAGLPGKLQHQAVGETEGRPGAEEIERRCDDVRILQCQVLVIQQHFDGSDQAGGFLFVYGGKNPGGFGQRENRYPSPLFDEASADTACRASSRAMSRTRTLVSTPRMT